jgi:hypothetical protein
LLMQKLAVLTVRDRERLVGGCIWVATESQHTEPRLVLVMGGEGVWLFLMGARV